MKRGKCVGITRCGKQNRLCKFDFASLNKNRERIETNSSLSSARGFRGSSRSSMYIPTTLYFLLLAKNLIFTRHWENSLRDVKKILWDAFVNALKNGRGGGRISFFFFYERKKKDLKLSGFLEIKIIGRNVENLYFTGMSKNNFCWSFNFEFWTFESMFGLKKLIIKFVSII